METLVENKWYTNHVDTVWWDNYQELEYKNEQFNDADALEYWRDLGFSQQKFTGDLYDMRNAEPNWIDPFKKIFPWKFLVYFKEVEKSYSYTINQYKLFTMTL